MILGDDLVDFTENGSAGFVEHFNLDTIAELHEFGCRFAIGDGLQAPDLGDTGRPVLAAYMDTVPDPTTVPAMSGRDLAAWEINRGRSKVLSTPALGDPSFMPFMVECRGRWILPPSPGIAQFIRRYGNGCKRGMGLGLVKTELLGQFRWYQVP